MDASNDILFNASALHSLKRQQLIVLCKRYKVKASGKVVGVYYFHSECSYILQCRTTTLSLASRPMASRSSKIAGPYTLPVLKIPQNIARPQTSTSGRERKMGLLNMPQPMRRQT